ncbi:SHOCT domain-containing protein [Streptomyces poonensis]|nr:SHOCT domain-containing protein [Streptomyces poonensis]
MTGWGWFTMSIGTVVLWALLITIAILIIRARNRASGPPRTSASAPPGQLLAERFARGEIDEEEYQRRLAVLRGNGSGLAEH